jgi:hypothetical protein
MSALYAERETVMLKPIIRDALLLESRHTEDSRRA